MSEDMRVFSRTEPSLELMMPVIERWMSALMVLVKETRLFAQL